MGGAHPPSHSENLRVAVLTERTVEPARHHERHATRGSTPADNDAPRTRLVREHATSRRRARASTLKAASSRPPCSRILRRSARRRRADAEQPERGCHCDAWRRGLRSSVTGTCVAAAAAAAVAALVICLLLCVVGAPQPRTLAHPPSMGETPRLRITQTAFRLFRGELYAAYHLTTLAKESVPLIE